jgi:nucleoside-diphosphate-sugar epimerase
VIRACLDAGIRRLVFTSTTALYGDAATPSDRAGWVTEDTIPVPRTIYHRTKMLAETLLQEAATSTNLRVTVLRMSRCFPEPAPLMACYRLHRGIDARDVATAHELAVLGSDKPFRVYVVSGATPFVEEDVFALKSDAASVFARREPGLVKALSERNWPVPRTVDRIYSSARIQRELGWRPRFDYREVLRQYDEESPEVLPPVEKEQ